MPATRAAQRAVGRCGGDESGRLVEEAEEQGGGHLRIPRHGDPLLLGPGEDLGQQGDAGHRIERTAGLDAEDGRRVGEDPGHGGVGTGVHVGPAAPVQLVPHAPPLARRRHHPVHQLALELLHHGGGDLGLGGEVVVERAPGHAGPLRDLLAAGGREALLGEERPGRIEEGPAGAGRPGGLGLPGLRSSPLVVATAHLLRTFTCGRHAC